MPARASCAAAARYNELVQSLGGRTSVPAVGFAIGLERIRLALEHQGAALPAPPQPQVLVAAASPDAAHTGMRTAQKLREHGIRAEYDLRQRSARAQVGYASRREIPYLLLVEDRTENLLFHNLAEGTAESLSLSEVVQVLNG